MKNTISVAAILVFAINLYAQDAGEYCKRGYEKYAIGDYKGARADSDKAIKLNPNYAEAMPK